MKLINKVRKLWPGFYFPMNSVSEMIRDVKMEMTPADPKHHHNKHIIMGQGFKFINQFFKSNILMAN